MAKGRDQCDWEFLETVLSRTVLKKCSFTVNSLLPWPRVKCESAAKDLKNAQEGMETFSIPLQKSLPQGNLPTLNHGYSLLNETIVLWNSPQASVFLKSNVLLCLQP